MPILSRIMTAEVTSPREIDVQWDERANKLRIADAQTDKTLALFTNDQMYGLTQVAPDGCVFVRNTDTLPDIRDALVRSNVVEIVKRMVHPHTRELTFIARVKV